MSVFAKLKADLVKAKAIFDRAAAKREAATKEFDAAIAGAKAIIEKAIAAGREVAGK